MGIKDVDKSIIEAVGAFLHCGQKEPVVMCKMNS